MATIAKANIDITAEDRSARAFKSLRDRMQRLQGNTKAMLGSLAALVGAAGIGAAVRGTLNELDKLGKTADKIGISTSALQELRFAAEQSGVGVQALDQGLQRFTRRTAEAAKGTGVLAKEFEALGINLKNADGSLRSTDSVLMDYADAIANTKDQQEQLRLAFAAFDSEGAALVNLFRQGSIGVEELRQKLRDLGGVIDEELIRESEAANDAMNELSKAFKGVFVSVVAGAAPYIEKMSDYLTDLIGKVRGFFISLSDVSSLTTSQIQTELEKQMALYDQYQSKYFESREGLAGALDKIFGQDKAAHYSGLMEETASKIVELQEELRAAEKNTKSLTEAGDKLGDSLDGVSGSSDDATESLKELKRSFATGEAQFDAFMKTGQTAINDVTGAIDKRFQPELEEALKLWDQLTTAATTFGGSAPKEVDRMSDTLFDMGEALRNIQNNFMGGVSSTIYDAVFGDREQLRQQKRELRQTLSDTLADISKAEAAKEITHQEAVDQRLEAEKKFNEDMETLMDEGTKSWLGYIKGFAKEVLKSFIKLGADIAAALFTKKIFGLFNIDAGSIKLDIGGNDIGGLINGGGIGGGVGQGVGAGVLGKIGGAISGGFKGVVGAIKGIFTGGSSAAGTAGLFGGGATPASMVSGSGWGASMGGWGAAVPLGIAAFGFGRIASKKAQRRENQSQFFNQVGTGTFDQLNPVSAFRGMDEATGEFFVTMNEGWHSTIEALKEANALIDAQGAMYDERGNELLKISGNAEQVKTALSNAAATGFEFAGSLTNAIEKGNNLRVSIQGDSEAIQTALNAATAMGIGGFQNLEETATGVSATLTGDIQRWNDFLQSFVNESIRAAISGVGALGSEAGNATQRFLELAKAASSVNTGRTAGATIRVPDHRSGLDYVPYDGYLAKLHQGERVQTATERRQSERVSSMDDRRIVGAIEKQTREIRRQARARDYQLA